jgi:outer membrane protein TolC
LAEAKIEGLSERGLGGALEAGVRADNDFKSAVLLKSPLLFLKESGKLGAASQKLDFQRLEGDRVERAVEVDTRAAMFDLATLGRILERQRSSVRQARLLREAEQVRFDNGESTLLILNLRERLVLDESAKLAALEGKVAGARGALALATGDRTLLLSGR